jgi:hypothetical protein
MTYSVTEKPKPRRILYTCAICNSENVEQKCWCSWDKDTQQWVFADDPHDETYYCNACGDCPDDLNVESCDD